MAKHLEIPLHHRRALNRLRPNWAASTLQPGEWVRALRWQLRMTQRQLALRSGVSQQHIALIESRKMTPRIETLAALFDALYCDIVLQPSPRRRLSDVAAERAADRGLARPSSRIWDTM